MINLKTLPEASKQAVFDQVTWHLVTQNEVSTHDAGHGEPAYRGDNGLKCAVGCLISDEEYTPVMEGEDWDDLCQDLGIEPNNKTKLIRDLQEVHDDNPADGWPEMLWFVARNHGLDNSMIYKAMSHRDQMQFNF